MQPHAPGGGNFHEHFLADHDFPAGKLGSGDFHHFHHPDAEFQSFPSPSISFQ
jgi:hypothetical protein